MEGVPNSHGPYPDCDHFGPLTMVPQVSSVSPGSFLCPWFYGHSSWRGARHSCHHTKSMPLLTILVVGTPILKLPPSMVRHCVYLKARPLQCNLKFGIVPKVSSLCGRLVTLDLTFKDLTSIRPTYFGTHFGCPLLCMFEPNSVFLSQNSGSVDFL